MSWIDRLEMELSTHLLYPSHRLRKKGRISCFTRFITTLNTLPRIARPSVGFFTRRLGGNPGAYSKGARSAKEPSTQPQKKGGGGYSDPWEPSGSRRI